MRLPLREIGRRGFEYAARMLDGDGRPEVAADRGVLRGSTAAPPAPALPRATATPPARAPPDGRTRSPDRVVLVTGSSRGIGAEVAVKAAAEGATVAVHYHRRATAAEQTLARVRAAGADGEAFAADIARRCRRRRRSSTRSIERFGRIDGLVNNAGRTQVGPFLEIEPADWDEVIRTDLTAAFHTCRAALPSMVERGSGSIVNIASRLGQMGVAETAAYSAAKAGLIGLTRALAREFGPRGIRVNAVAPGVTVTEMTDRPRRQRGGPAPAARHAARAGSAGPTRSRTP